MALDISAITVTGNTKRTRLFETLQLNADTLDAIITAEMESSPNPMAAMIMVLTGGRPHVLLLAVLARLSDETFDAWWSRLTPLAGYVNSGNGYSDTITT